MREHLRMTADASHNEQEHAMNFMNVDYSTKIPNNVNLSEDRQVLKALEGWHPGYMDWWSDMGPEGFQQSLVYLRTAYSVDPRDRHQEADPDPGGGRPRAGISGQPQRGGGERRGAGGVVPSRGCTINPFASPKSSYPRRRVSGTPRLQ